MQVRVTCPGTEGETEAWGLHLAHAQEAGTLGGLQGGCACAQGTGRAGTPQGTGKVSKDSGSSLCRKMILMQTRPRFRGPCHPSIMCDLAWFSF